MFDSIMRSVAERRMARLREVMEEDGLDAVLLFEGDWVGHKLSLTRHFSLVVLTPDGISVLADPSLYHEAVRESPWEVKLVKDLGPAALADEILRVLPGPRLGINKAWGRGKLTFLHVDLLEALRSRGITVTDATQALTEVFDKPYDDEVPIIEWLSVTTSRAIEAAAEELRPGMRENEVAAIIDKILEEEGIVERWFATIVASGPRAAAPHAKTSTRRIGYGDPVVIDVGPYWMGYDGCVAHTLVAGRSEYWEGVVEKVLEALEAGLDIAKPGTPVRELDEVPRRVLREASLPNYPHLSGHPIGGYYKPVIAGFLGYKLEENMAFAYEPATYIPGRGGARIEPHILVTSTNHRILTPIHKDLLE